MRSWFHYGHKFLRYASQESHTCSDCFQPLASLGFGSFVSSIQIKPFAVPCSLIGRRYSELIQASCMLWNRMWLTISHKISKMDDMSKHLYQRWLLGDVGSQLQFPWCRDDTRLRRHVLEARVRITKPLCPAICGAEWTRGVNTLLCAPQLTLLTL